MTITISIPGLASTTKRPGFYGETKYAAGAITAGDLPIVLLLAGNKTSAGSMTVDSTPQLVLDAETVDALAGPGSELAMLAYGIDGNGGALQLPGVAVWIAAITEAASSPVAATATITIAGTWTVTGTLTYRLSGIPIQVVALSTDVFTDVAQKIVNAINANARFPYTAARSSGVITITAKSKGPRGNWHSLFQDKTNAPSGLTSTLAGGSSMTGGGVHFTGGAANDDPAALLAAIAATQFDRVVPACGDATLDAVNIAKWKTQLNTQAGATVGILGHCITASSDTLTNAASIAGTTLNDARFQVLHLLNSETHPSAIAATFGAMRCQAEQQYPNASYDDVVIPQAKGQTQSADKPSNATIETALGEGVTELYTAPDGTVRVSRSIVSRCLNGSSPDYRILDTGEAIVPDFVRLSASLLWSTVYKVANPLVADDPPEELKALLSGVGSPSSWDQAVTKMLRDFERGVGIPNGLPIVTDVDNHLPVSTFDSSAKRIMQICEVDVVATQHSIGVSVRQVSNA